MGNVDGVPVASQVKSLVQVSKGQREEALATQNRFTERCVGAAQVKSLIELVRGDVDAAAETQRKFLANARRLLEASEVADAVPGVSQLKSAAFVADGEISSAVDTHRNFMRRCPVVSQVRSVCDLVTKGPEEALDGQREFLEFASSSADKVPGLGHLKALAHRHLQRDEERADLARAAAERSRISSQRMLGGALKDMLTASSSEASLPPEAVCNTCGPLSEEDIRRHTLLFDISADQLKSHSACPICLVDFQLGEEALTLRCFHVFHPLCGDRWLRANGNCPVCRVGAAPVSEQGGR